MLDDCDLAEDLEKPALSPSVAKNIVTECPRYAWASHRLLGNLVLLTKEQRAIRERGNALHNLVLEGGNKIVPLTFNDFKTSAAKAARDDVRASGLYPILDGVLDELREAAENIEFECKRILLDDFSYDGKIFDPDGTFEERLEWFEQADGGEVECHGVADWVSVDRTLVVDLKTTTGTVHPDACDSALLKQSGVIQGCAYPSAIQTLDPKLAGRVEMLFLYAQSKPPYLVTPVHCAGDMRHIGEDLWLDAVEKWQQCLAKGQEAEHWPTYTDGRVHEAHAPAWAMAQHEARLD